MNRSMLAVAALAAVLSSLPSALAGDTEIKLGVPAYGGTGCPAGSASAVLSDDRQSLSILFDSFVAEAGKEAGKTIARKACNLAVPVHVPQGFSVSIISIDYRGFNALPSGGRSQFNVEYFFAGATGPRYTKTWYGPMNQDYLLSNRLQATALVWSRCGEDVILRTNASLTTQTNSRKEQTLSTVDSIDVEAGVRYLLQWKRC